MTKQDRALVYDYLEDANPALFMTICSVQPREKEEVLTDIFKSLDFNLWTLKRAIKIEIEPHIVKILRVLTSTLNRTKK